MTPQRKKSEPPARSDNEIRRLILEYFFDRNRTATSARGKKGYAARISDIKRDLKAAHGMSQSEVVGNLNYLISQGWIEEEAIEKSVPLRSGTVIPQVTTFYKISAAGIDKIEGPGEFTLDKFKGIKIEATGRNIITVGDGNQVNANYQDVAGALVELRNAVLTAGIPEAEKMDAVADIDSIESQLVKASPSRMAIRGAWEGLKKLSTVVGVADSVGKVAGLLAPLL